VDTRERRHGKGSLIMARNPTDWMWAHACELIEEAERMHRQFFRLATSDRVQALWEPPVNVFEDEREIVIVVALPGVPASRVEVTTEGGSLVVRADSPLAFAAAGHAIRQLEIPYGRFERRLLLPLDELEAGSHELTNGCLVLRLRKKA
jgi:HSP20 family molecular chaperone IbpA